MNLGFNADIMRSHWWFRHLIALDDPAIGQKR
jgi:hypothetical protein